MKLPDSYPATALVNLGHLRHNLRHLRACAPDSQPLAIIKADAYGHGSLPVALTVLEEGVNWLGQAQIGEALHLRKELDKAGVPSCLDPEGPRLFTWIVNADPAGKGPKQLSKAIMRGLDISASNLAELEAILAAGKRAREKAQTEKTSAKTKLPKTGQSEMLPPRQAYLAAGCPPPRVHLKIDVGNSRAGSPAAVWPELVAQAARAESAGQLQVVGIWSHLQSADEATPEGIERTNQQIARFEQAVQVAQSVGLENKILHLSATSGGLWHPRAHFDLIRWGIGLYGLSPDPTHPRTPDFLRPVMELSAPLLSVKRVPAGEGVSYNATWTTPGDRWLGLVPLGYADGINRRASNRAKVWARLETGELKEFPVVGRICMDQFVIDLGPADQPAPLARGQRIYLFGSGEPDGLPSVDKWAQAIDTINYEVVTTLGPRVPRVYWEPANRSTTETMRCLTETGLNPENGVESSGK
ncbi:alanine racemase [Boudabousia liubingyangii]|uniref:Alanine racemase n=1 Tax=Boudabousia liubingyangii TaxID=1921764 RepID=A0A1Q5PQC1_9ACTO|nr:alanine racemase [Boudabousia liubingyangii]OKL49747.1 alanine racemase [Boudabousia liubingyangii]